MCHGVVLPDHRRHARPPWQFYVVYEQTDDQHGGEGGAELASFLKTVSLLGKESDYGASSVFYSTGVARKRRREADEAHAGERTNAEHEPSVGLFVRHAISYARYLADPSTLEELRAGILKQCSAFWDSFDGLESGEGTEINKSVDVHLAFLCGAADPLSDKTSPTQQSCLLKVAGVLVRPTSLAMQEKPSRVTLLLRHLEERLTGTTYDGSTISCIAIGENGVLSRGFTVLRSDGSHPLLSAPEISFFNPILIAPKETASADEIAAEEAVLELTEVRLKAFEDAAPAQKATMTDFPPQAAILEELAPADPFTVLVLRNVSRTVSEMCNSPPCSGVNGDSEPKKSYVQYVMEECCQYGKVISYFCYQDKTKGLPNSSASARSSVSRADSSSNSNSSDEAICAAAVAEKSPNTTLSETTAALFIEFQSASCALEATKVFAQRFALSSNSAEEKLRPKVTMMRNSAFYAGVAQENHPSSDDDLLFDEPILAG